MYARHIAFVMLGGHTVGMLYLQLNGKTFRISFVCCLCVVCVCVSRTRFFRWVVSFHISQTAPYFLMSVVKSSQRDREWDVRIQQQNVVRGGGQKCQAQNRPTTSSLYITEAIILSLALSVSLQFSLARYPWNCNEPSHERERKKRPGGQIYLTTLMELHLHSHTYTERDRELRKKIYNLIKTAQNGDV